MKRFILLAAFALTASSLQAADPVNGSTAARIKGALAQVVPGTPDSITATPMQGIYEVAYGPRVIYVSEDGRYLVNGELFDVQQRSNLTEQRRSQARLTTLKAMDQNSMIIYPAKGKTKHTVTVFTDIDCGYCRKLHQGMAEMNNLGITVRYLSYPRAGVGSDSYKKAGNVWCSKDRNKAMDKAKSDQAMTDAGSCDAPIKNHMAMAELFGINGTPAIVLEDGRLIPGYLPPQQLLAEINRKQ
ncbi:MAG TPA: DsbC family protein [Gammaproteobacteria bacterium]